MKRFFYSLMIAAIAVLPLACEKEPVPNTGDSAPLAWYILGIAVSLGVMAWIIIARRKEEKAAG